MARSRKEGGPCRPNHSGVVGYCRPPEEHRFREGEPSRNPYGRRGKPRWLESSEASTPDFLDETVTVTVDGKPTQMTRDKAVDHFLFSHALKGDVRAARQLDRRRDERARRQASTRTVEKTASEADASTDAEIIKRALTRQAMDRCTPVHGPSPVACQGSGASDEGAEHD